MALPYRNVRGGGGGEGGEGWEAIFFCIVQDYPLGIRGTVPLEEKILT